MSVLTELEELSALFDGRADINDSGGPNEAMRVQQMLADIMPRVAELIEAANALSAWYGVRNISHPEATRLLANQARALAACTREKQS